MTARTRLTAPPVVLALLMVIAAAFNLTKAVHLDDTAYLKMAEQIAAHPLQPMDFLLNWGDEGRLAFEEMNQPPLFFYFLAGVIATFGPSEIALHAAMAMVSGLAIFLMYRVAHRVAPEHALLVTACCALGPAFLPAQNLMTDVPSLALWLAAIDQLLLAGEQPGGRHYALAGLAVAAACLVKYSAIGLFAAMGIIILARGHVRAIWSLGIPVAALAAWSVWNYASYGDLHLLTRPTTFDASATGRRSIDWITGIGLALPWAWMSLFHRVSGKWKSMPTVFALASGAAMFTAMQVWKLGPFEARWTTAVLVFGGAAAIAAVFSSRDKAHGSSKADRDHTTVLTWWLIGAAAQAIVLAPFMATRHVLPATVPLALLIARAHPEWFTRRRVATATVAITFAFGGVLAAADYAWAALYPRYVKIIAEKYPTPPDRVVAQGHWGWQWYINRQGWREYDKRRTVLRVGDLFIEPAFISHQQFRRAHYDQLERIRIMDVRSSGLTRIRPFTLYAFSWARGISPITVDDKPIEYFDIYRVVREMK